MYNPLVIFTSAALATLAALLGVTYDKWSATAHNQIATAESEMKSAPTEGKLQNMAPPVAAEEPTAEKTELASIAPRESTAPTLSTEAPAADAPKGTESDETGGSKPTFDTIRIERDGSAVIAGRGLPESDVTVMLNGSPLGSVKADLEGAWILVPEEPVPPGDHQLTLRMNRPGALTIDSEQSVALKVPERLGEEALVVLSDTNRPSRVLQKPELSENETTVAKSDLPASMEPGQSNMPSPMDLTLGTVDYNDAGEIIFSGRAAPGASIRLYVDNRAAGDASVATDGTWSFAGTKAIAPGSHSLRVDQLQGDGSVSRRIELPFVRAAPQEVASLNQPVTAPSAADEPSKAGEEGPSAVEPTVAVTDDEPPPPPSAALEESQAGEMAKVENPVETPSLALEPPAGPAANLPSETSTASADSPTVSTESKPQRNGKIVIQPGNSLWRISRVIYGRGIEYTVIYEANKDDIRNPNLIYPGQIFATPGVVPPENIDPKTTAPLANSTSSPTSEQ